MRKVRSQPTKLDAAKLDATKLDAAKLDAAKLPLAATSEPLAQTAKPDSFAVKSDATPTEQAPPSTKKSDLASITAGLKQLAAKPPIKERKLPELATDIIMVGKKMVLKRFAQSADMAGYIFHVKGKPTFMYVMAKLNPETALKGGGFLKGRSALVLTDRDGPLDKANAFLNHPDKEATAAAMVPGALAAAKKLHEAGVGLAIVTNQGGYQVGSMSFEDTVAVNVRVAQQVADAGGHVDAIFICPFSKGLENPGPDDVDARKPAPGMPLYAKQLAEKAKIPVLGLIGDQRTDGAAAQGAGMMFYALTDPTYGRWEAELAAANKKGETLPVLDAADDRLKEVPDFAAAVEQLLVSSGPPSSLIFTTA